MRLWFCRKSWEGLASLYFSPCGYTERRWLPVNQESIRARTGVFCWHLDLEFLSLQTCRKIILLVHLLSENLLAFWILPSIKYKMPFTGSCLHTRTPAELLLWERGSGLMRRWDAAEAGWSQEARPSGFIIPGLFMFPSLCFLTAIRWTALLHTSSFSIAVMFFFITDPQQAAPNVHYEDLWNYELKTILPSHCLCLHFCYINEEVTHMAISDRRTKKTYFSQSRE